MPLACVSVLLLLLAACQALPLSEPHTEEQLIEEQLIDDNNTEDISTRILASNNQSDTFLLEGDLLPPKHRNAMKCWYNSCLWKKNSDGLVYIPYTVNREFNSYESQVISSALRDFSGQTCIRFVPRQTQSDYISIENQSGCFSALGRQGGRQVLSLNRGGCVHKGIVQHEFSHALGFQHEQTRSDRDQYVRINWANMNPAMAYNFYRSDTNNLNTPYDYGSIMHYGRTAFSNNGRETITPLSSTPVTIGQRQALSSWDVKRINMLYSC